MTYRNTVLSPSGYKYYVILFDSLDDMNSFVRPEYYDVEVNGCICLLNTHDDLRIVYTEGPETVEPETWLVNFGYSVNLM